MISKYVITSLLVTSFISNVMGQIANVQGMDNVVLRIKKYDDIKGSPYLYPAWNSGTLTDRNGKVYSNLLLKYDTYKDLVELNQEGQVMEVSAMNYPKFTLMFIEPGSNKVINHSFSTGYGFEGFSKTSYFDILLEGRITLLKKYKSSFIENNVSDYGTSDSQKSFQSKIVYFVISEGAGSKEIKPNKKSVMDVFSEHSSRIEVFLNNKKKIKSEDDLIEIIRFLDEK